MNIKLNTGQTLALFLPLVAGCVVFAISTTNIGQATLLFMVTVALMTGYQAYLIFKFNAAAEVKSEGHKMNALIPFIFSVFYLVRIARQVFVTDGEHHRAALTAGPRDDSDGFPLKLVVYGLFFAHAFITFYFINTPYVSKKIKLVTDLVKQKQLKANFLTPMKRLVTTSIVFIIIAAAITAIALFS